MSPSKNRLAIVYLKGFDLGIRTFTLDNDFVVTYMDGLDGGGIDHLPDFRNALQLAGQEKYDRAVEWCAGFGVIGFDFLNRNVCNHMSFIDCHPPAIEWLGETINQNDIIDKTDLYLVDQISLIPEDVKWDLVLANPPHSFETETKQYFQNSISDPIGRADVIRLTCDEGFLIHREFFANIRNHLNPNADIFISEVGHLETIEAMAQECGLLVMGRYDAPKLSHDSKTPAVIFHFKEPA